MFLFISGSLGTLMSDTTLVACLTQSRLHCMRIVHSDIVANVLVYTMMHFFSNVSASPWLLASGLLHMTFDA